MGADVKHFVVSYLHGVDSHAGEIAARPHARTFHGTVLTYVVNSDFCMWGPAKRLERTDWQRLKFSADSCHDG